MSPGTKALLKGFPATLSNIFGFLWQHLPLVPARSATAIAVIPPWSLQSRAPWTASWTPASTQETLSKACGTSRHSPGMGDVQFRFVF